MSISRYMKGLVGATAIAATVFWYSDRGSVGVAADDLQAEYQPFPDGYGYLQNEAALQAAINSGNRAAFREHGRKILAGINQPAAGLDWPI